MIVPDRLVRARVASAYANGSRVEIIAPVDAKRYRERAEWRQYSCGRCEAPLEVKFSGHHENFDVWDDVRRYIMRPEQLATLRQMVRCRKCDACRQAHASEWAARTKSELMLSSGTAFFVTLTLADPYADDPYFVSDEVTKFLKRLRKNYRWKMRYLCVEERGKRRGRLHYHLVVIIEDYEQPAAIEVAGDEFSLTWPFGFVDASVIADIEKSASYVSKYATKSPERARVRASRGWGVPAECRARSALAAPKAPFTATQERPARKLAQPPCGEKVFQERATLSPRRQGQSVRKEEGQNELSDARLSSRGPGHWLPGATFGHSAVNRAGAEGGGNGVRSHDAAFKSTLGGVKGARRKPGAVGVQWHHAYVSERGYPPDPRPQHDTNEPPF